MKKNEKLKKTMIIAIMIIALSFISCTSIDTFGVSHFNKINNISFENDINNMRLDSTTRTITIKLDSSADISKAIVSEINISPLANIKIGIDKNAKELMVGDTIDLSIEKLLTIIAENEDESVWVLSATIRNGETSTVNPDVQNIVAGFIEVLESSSSDDEISSSTTDISSDSNDSSSGSSSSSSQINEISSSSIVDQFGPQIEGSDFDSWDNSEDFPQVNPTSIWDSGNYGSSLAGKTYPTTEYALTSGSAVKLETHKISILSIGKIASGSIYTGKFDRSLGLLDLNGLSDGNDAIDFGTPFTEKPTGFSIRFKYTSAGNIEKCNLFGCNESKADNKGPDLCDLYVLLENRDGGNITRVATAWYRDSNDNNTSKDGVISISNPDADDLRTMEMELAYGSLPNDAPALKSSEALGDGSEDVTHIKVVFASSAFGNLYEGAIGSTLIVDDFKLLY